MGWARFLVFPMSLIFLLTFSYCCEIHFEFEGGAFQGEKKKEFTSETP
jgi:hypothetical protein